MDESDLKTLSSAWEVAHKAKGKCVQGSFRWSFWQALEAAICASYTRDNQEFVEMAIRHLKKYKDAHGDD